MKTIIATVLYPVYIQMEVPEDISEECVREKILDEADSIFETSTIEPIIQECNFPELID